MHAVIARDRGQPQIGDDEPLRRHFLPVFLLHAIDLGGHHIGARLQVLDHFGDRDGGHRHGVGRALRQVDLALPGLLAGRAGDVLGRIAVERALEDALAHRGGDRAIADPVDHHVGGLGVHRGDRQAAAEPGGHHIGIVGKADERRAIGHIEVELDIGAQLFAIGRGEPGTQLDVIAPAMLDAGDADLALFGFDRHGRRIVDHHIARKIGVARGQRVREHRADARVGGFGVDLVGGDAETVLGHRLFERRLTRRIVDQREAGAVGGDGLAPHFTARQRQGERAQRIGALGDRLGQHQRVHRRIGRVDGEVIDAVAGRRLDHHPGFALARQLQPYRGVVLVDRQRLPIRHHRRRGVRLRRGGIAGGHQVGIAHFRRRRIGLRQAGRHVAGGIHQVLRRERQLAQPRLDRLGQRRSEIDAAGRGALERRLGADIALEEAPLGLLVIGEGAADLVVGTGRRTGVDTDILQHRIVEPGQVRAGQQRDVAIGRVRRTEGKGSGHDKPPDRPKKPLHSQTPIVANTCSTL